MRSPARSFIQRIFIGWAVFGSGMVLIMWLHTFTDRVAHRMILPLLFLLWVALGVCLWDGCKTFTLWKRTLLMFVQAAVAAIACTLLISYFLYHSP